MTESSDPKSEIASLLRALDRTANELDETKGKLAVATRIANGRLAQLDRTIEQVVELQTERDALQAVADVARRWTDAYAVVQAAVLTGDPTDDSECHAAALAMLAALTALDEVTRG